MAYAGCRLLQPIQEFCGAIAGHERRLFCKCIGGPFRFNQLVACSECVEVLSPQAVASPGTP